MKFSSLIKFLKALRKLRKKADITRNSAALSFFACFAIVPLLYFLLAIARLFLQGEDAKNLVLNQVKSYLGPDFVDTAAIVISELSQLQTTSGSNLLSIATFCGALILFISRLQKSMDQVLEIEAKGSHFLAKRLKELSSGLLVLVAFLGFLGTKLIGTSLVSLIFSITRLNPEIPFGVYAMIEVFASLGLGTLLLFVCFHTLVRGRVSWLRSLEAAALTAGLLSLGDHLLAWYLSRSVQANFFGASSALIALLIWVYYNSQIFLTGLSYFRLRQKKRRA